MRVVLGPAGTLELGRHRPGRGAWLCRLNEVGFPDPGCVEMARRRGAFPRALRATVAAGQVDLLVAMTRERARMVDTGRRLTGEAPDEPMLPNEKKD